MLEKVIQKPSTGKADRFNELVSFELESKLEFTSPHPIDKVAEIIFTAVQPLDGQYIIAPSLPAVGESTTLVRHYAYRKKKGKIKKAFTVTERLRDGLLQMKRKGTATYYGRNVICKREAVETLAWTSWTKQAEQIVIQREVTRAAVRFRAEDLFLVVGIVNRRKLKIRIVNRINQRAYTVAIDETTEPGGEKLQQIEIEYIGVEPGVGWASSKTYALNPHSTVQEIVAEIEAIEDLVLDICARAGIRLNPTRQTKFKWLRNLHMAQAFAEYAEVAAANSVITIYNAYQVAQIKTDWRQFCRANFLIQPA